MCCTRVTRWCMSELRSCVFLFFFSSRRRHTRLQGDWSSDVCSSDLESCASAGLRFLQDDNGKGSTSEDALAYIVGNGISRTGVSAPHGMASPFRTKRERMGHQAVLA